MRPQVADMQVQERVVSNDGHDYRGVTSTTRTASDLVTGVATRRSSTRAWWGRPLAARIVRLAAGIVFIFLGFDFIFRATGAADVGFGAFVYSIGGALAPPFAGIFKTASTTSGTVVVWADILAAVVYAIAAVIVAKVVSMSTDQRARRSA
jgi:threonine/homoserine/homoserine lactone efflux protein